jgi:hypothetical protein
MGPVPWNVDRGGSRPAPPPQHEANISIPPARVAIGAHLAGAVEQPALGRWSLVPLALLAGHVLAAVRLLDRPRALGRRDEQQHAIAMVSFCQRVYLSSIQPSVWKPRQGLGASLPPQVGHRQKRSEATCPMLLTAFLALFFQTRNGFNGRAFRIVKFRSMHVLDNGHACARQWRCNSPGDAHRSRVTRLGR